MGRSQKPVARSQKEAERKPSASRILSSFFWLLAPCFWLLPSVPGCASAVQAGRNTALDSVDLVRMTDDMAMKIVADPEVQAAIEESGNTSAVIRFSTG